MSTKIKTLTVDAMMVAITCVCAMIAIPLSFTPVPITMVVFAVLLTGAILPKGQAFLVQVVYLLLGIVGVPIFAGFRSGLGYAMGPTGGYLVIFPVMSFIIALCVEKIKFKNEKLRFIPMAIGMVIAMIICYLCGTLWLAQSLGKSFVASIEIGVTPYVFPDICKVILAILIALPVGNVLKKMK